MAQPPLSAALRQLERQLGVALLDRSSRQVRLTAAGEQLLERGRELLAHADTVVRDVQAVERSPSGLLRGGLSPAGRFGLVPDLLERWSTAAPGVMLHTSEDTTGALLRDVRQGRLDLAVVFCPCDVNGLASTTLRDEPAVVHVRDDHPLAGRAHVALDELAGETLLVAGGRTVRATPPRWSRPVELPASSPAPGPTPTPTSARKPSAKASASCSTSEPPSARSSRDRSWFPSSRRSRSHVKPPSNSVR